MRLSAAAGVAVAGAGALALVPLAAPAYYASLLVRFFGHPIPLPGFHPRLGLG